MGVVYRALDLGLQRVVAIKTLPSVSPDRSVRLRREARAMAAVVHTNLATIYGAETWHGIPLIVFEFLEGGTLADRLRRGRLAWAEVLDLGITMADVLGKIHSIGILHRDIKPSNIGYTGEGVPKLMDFGLARILHESWGDRVGMGTGEPHAVLSGTTVTGIAGALSRSSSDCVAGTLRYLSPEALKNRRPDPTFDLWALTIVLFEALTGEHPMAEAPPFEALRLISEARIPDIRELRSDCTEEVAGFFESALARDARRRPGTAAELKGALIRLLH